MISSARQLGWFVLLVLVVLAYAWPALGQTRPTLVIRRLPGDVENLAPLRAELRAMKWRVIERSGQSSSVSLAELGEAEGARAVVELYSAPTRAKLWLAATDTENVEETWILGMRDARELALRIAETLRTRWAEPWLTLEEPLPQPASPRAELATSSERSDESTAPSRPHVGPEGPKLLWGTLAPALLVSPKPLGLQASGVLKLIARPTSWLGFNFLGLIPVTSRSLQEPEGRTTLRLWLLGASANGFVEPWDGWEFSAGAGPLVGFVDVEGTAEEPFTSESDVVRVRGAQLCGSVAHVLSRYARLRLTATLGIGFERARVLVADRAVLHWGTNYAIIDLGLEFAIPGT